MPSRIFFFEIVDLKHVTAGFLEIIGLNNREVVAGSPSRKVLKTAEAERKRIILPLLEL